MEERLRIIPDLLSLLTSLHRKKVLVMLEGDVYVEGVIEGVNREMILLRADDKLYYVKLNYVVSVVVGKDRGGEGEGSA